MFNFQGLVTNWNSLASTTTGPPVATLGSISNFLLFQFSTTSLLKSIQLSISWRGEKWFLWRSLTSPSPLKSANYFGIKILSNQIKVPSTKRPFTSPFFGKQEIISSRGTNRAILWHPSSLLRRKAILGSNNFTIAIKDDSSKYQGEMDDNSKHWLTEEKDKGRGGWQFKTQTDKGEREHCQRHN